MNIESWLAEFKQAWLSHDIDRVLTLFTEDVEYWETPLKRLNSIDELRVEWRGILLQDSIQITTHVYSSTENRHAVIWHLRYVDQADNEQVWAGTYLITLNGEGKCTYFHHAGEK